MNGTAMGTYSIRPATPADRAVICDQRRRMFDEIGRAMHGEAAAAFDAWLEHALAAGVYHGWLAVTDAGEIAAGAGVTVVPWPPHPTDPGSRHACVYNVFTEPRHRRRGLARNLMEQIHAWCRGEGIRTVRLHASDAGRPVYASLGYTPTNEMVVRLA